MRLAKPLLCVVVATALLAGCARKSGDGSARAMPASAADQQSVQTIRDKYQRAYPESRVGVVIETLRGEPRVAIAELPAPSELRQNERVTFLDGRARVLTGGTI